MPYPQLTGRIGQSTAQAGGRAVFLAVVALAAILGLIAWRLAPRPVSTQPLPAVVVAEPVKPAPDPTKSDLSDDQQLHLAHAEQQLVTAAEQLVAARRLLASLSPALSRNYLAIERRRAANVDAACDAAQRAIEEARNNLNAVSSSGKD